LLNEPYSGFDVIEYAKSVQPSCKAIVLTSYPSTHTAVASIRLKAVDYLSKPVRKEKVLSAISNAIHGAVSITSSHYCPVKH